jgi:hypothetical protein
MIGVRSNHAQFAPHVHAREQVKARYGIDVRPEILVRKIERGEAEYVCEGNAYGDMPGQSRRQIWFVPVSCGPIWVKVVYQARLHGEGLIVTVLPPLWRWETEAIEKAARHDESLRAQRVKAKQFFRDLKQSEDADDFE